MWGHQHGAMPLGVVDVGSNTVRLLVTRRGRPILSEREMLRLGADVERDGRIGEEKLARTASVVGRYAEDARAAGVDRLEVLITSPGRQAANGEELAAAIETASRCPVRILSAAEEGRLGFLGAVEAASPPARRLVAVVDVGGGSAQVAVGTRRDGPQWIRSIDIGSQRLTSRLLRDDPPGKERLEAARAEVERQLESFNPPQPRTAYAIGGSARALKRIVGASLGPQELEAALALLAATPESELVRLFEIAEERTRTVAAGAVILAALQERLDAPLRVVRGGLRDGALVELAAKRAVA
jgi:exopolyphosphatase / guanosine-5'-triphosphate,3'-diphosphate pyrophosphatase